MRKPIRYARSGRPTPANSLPSAYLTLLMVAGGLCGVFLRAGSAASPTTYLLAVSAANAEDGQPDQNSSGQQSGALRQVLNQLIFRNREYEVLGERAAREIAEGRLSDGLSYLQRLLDQPQDSFVWPDVQAGLSSSRQQASKILSAETAATLRVYETLYGAEARRLLNRARESGDPALFDELTRRFYHTSAGFQAANRQATRWLDHGEYQLAARAFGRLLSEPAHRSRVTEAIVRKAEIANRLKRFRTLRHNTASRLSDAEGVRFAGSIAAAEWSAEDWTLAGADGPGPSTPHIHQANRHARYPARASAPFMTPLWTVGLSNREGGELLERMVGDWKQHQIGKLRPVAVANRPVVVGQTVVFRDFDGIRAIDQSTGATQWHYRCATSLSRAADEIERLFDSPSGHSPRASMLRMLQQTYAGNSTLGSVTTDGRRVYAIDFVDIMPQRSTSRRLARDMRRSGDSDMKFSRHANRLIALDVEPDDVGDDRHNEPAWTVGGAVGAAHWFFRMDRNDDGRLLPAEFLGNEAHFSEIDANGDEEISRTEAESAKPSSNAPRSMAGHFFLGPPLAVDGRLYAVTESDRQLNLVALDVESGGLLWSQGLGFVDRPIDSDPIRYALSCSPTLADGILICPTQLGILVAVDMVSGSLLWVYYYGDEDMSHQLGRWSRASQVSHGHPGFVSIPFVSDDRVIVLPRQSDYLHCIRLSTGEPLWKTPRGDAEYVGTVSDEIVLVVGSRTCRGLSVSSGEQHWSARLSTPSGRGLQVDSNYLIPLQDGRVATLQIDNGREIGLARALFDDESELADSQVVKPPFEASTVGEASPDERGDMADVTFPDADRRETGWRPGNLVAAGDMILSVNAQHVIAFPQAAALLDRVVEELSIDPDSTANMLLAAELELTLGDLNAAKSYLSTSMTASLTAEARDRAEQLMRELLYLELQASPADGTAILREIEKFSRTPLQQGRYLIHRTQLQFDRGDFIGVLESADRFAALGLTELLPMIGNSAHLVSPSSWTSSIVGRMQDHFGDAELEQIRVRIDFKLQETFAADTEQSLKRFLSIYARWPQADAVRARLADKLIARGAVHEAEMLLLENRRSPNPYTVVRAMRSLIELWDRLGLAEEAASLMHELEEKFGEVSVGDDMTGSEFVARFPDDRLTAAAYRRATTPDQPASRVRVSQQFWPRHDSELQEAHKSTRPTIKTPHHSTFRLVDEGDSKQCQLRIIHRQAGIEVGKFVVPAPCSASTVTQGLDIGHFVALGSVGAVHGFSLLEHQRPAPKWTVAPGPLAGMAETVKVGPSGPSFCVFQDRRHLLVVDPKTGRILWQRSDLDPNSGLDSDPVHGLFGDEHVLVLFAHDRNAYTLYRTMTGEELRRDRLDSGKSIRYWRIFGRKLFYPSASRNEKRLRVWDPLDDRFILDKPVTGQFHFTVTPERELVLLLPSNRLQVFDVDNEEFKVDLPLKLEPDATARLRKIQAFGDHVHYYVNLQQRSMATRSRTHTSYVTDTPLPVRNIRGDLIAVGRQDAELKWQRTFPHRTFLRTPHVRLPFLIGMSLVGDHFKGNRQSLLIEAINPATGHTIGKKPNIQRDRILQFTFEPSPSDRNPGGGRVELHAERSVITLGFTARPPDQRLDQPAFCRTPER